MGTLKRAFRNVWRKKARTVLVLLLLSFSIATMVSVYTSVDASKDKTQEMISDMEDTLNSALEQSERYLLLISISARPNFNQEVEANFITQEQITELESLDEIDTVVPTVNKMYGDFEEFLANRVPGSGSGGGGGTGLRDKIADLGGSTGLQSFVDYNLIGVPLEMGEIEDMGILPPDIIDGRALEDGDDYKVMISKELTEFFDVGVGGLIDIDGTSLNVVGVYSSEYDTNSVYSSISTAQDIAGMLSNEYQELKIYAKNDSVIDGLVTVLEDYYSDFRVVANRDLNARRVEYLEESTTLQKESLQGDMEEIESTGFMIMGISMGTASLIVLFIMLYTVRERTREIGTLKALGFTSKNVMKQFLAEGVILAIIGGVLGGLIGWVGSPVINNILMPSTDASTSGQISLVVIGVGILIMIALGSIGSIYPAWVAARKDPVEAMRHE